MEELQRTIDFQQYQLTHQEQRLRARIYVDFEAQLKEMADKVDVAHTMEQGRDLAIRERLLTDMAALRKDTMLKLQLQTWMVRFPPPSGLLPRITARRGSASSSARFQGPVCPFGCRA